MRNTLVGINLGESRGRVLNYMQTLFRDADLFKAHL